MMYGKSKGMAKGGMPTMSNKPGNMGPGKGMAPPATNTGKPVTRTPITTPRVNPQPMPPRPKTGMAKPITRTPINTPVVNPQPNPPMSKTGMAKGGMVKKATAKKGEKITMAKELVEGVDFEMVKAKNSNAMVRNIFTAKEKAARAAKAETTSRPKPRVTQGAKPAKPKEESPPPKRPAAPNIATAGMTKVDKARAEAKATPAYGSRIGPNKPATATTSNPNATSVRGKVKPRMTMAEQALADAQAARPNQRRASSNTPTTNTTTTTPAKPAVSPLKRLGAFLAGGGMSGATARAKAAEKAKNSKR